MLDTFLKPFWLIINSAQNKEREHNTFKTNEVLYYLRYLWFTKESPAVPTKVLTKESTLKRSLRGFKSRLFENDETTRNDVLEDISNSLANYLDAKRVKDFRIIIISYLFSVLPDFILQLSRFTSTKFKFQLSSSCFKFILHRVYNNFVSRM